MLKPFTIVCLIALLAVGVVSCKKELQDSQPAQVVFTIKPITEYDTTDYYIQSTDTALLPNTTFFCDVDGDGSNDLKFTYEYYNDTNADILNSYFKFYDLTNDSIITLSLKQGYHLGDTIKETLNWSKTNYFMLNSLETTSISGYFFDWNYGSTTNSYICFRKRIGNTYRYGWIKIGYNRIGPVVMQR